MSVLLLGVAVITLQACGGGSEEGHTIGVRVLNPQVTDGLAQVRFDIPGDVPATTGQLLVDGRKVATVKSFAGTFWLKVQDLNDGSHQVGLQAFSKDGHEVGQGQAAFSVQNPTVGVDAIEAASIVYPGLEFTVDLQAHGDIQSVTADLSALIPGLTSVSFFQTGDGLYELFYDFPYSLNAPEGWYTVPIFVTGMDGRTARFPDVQVFLNSGPLLPLTADTGNMELGALPSGDDLKARASLRQIAGDLSVVTGGTFQLGLDLQGNAVGAQLLVGVQGSGGHLVIPLDEAQAQTGHASVSLRLPEGAQLPEQKGTLTLKVALRDAQGQVSAAHEADVSYGVAREGNLRITLDWDTPTDVDLYAVNPAGTEIYYGNHGDDLGGQLDLDSNPGCEIDNVNHENIYWDMPPSGEYVVRVNYFEACNDLPANWHVTVQGCGLNLERTGHFDPAQATGGGSGAGLEILRFQAACKPFRVSGKARYELLTATGARNTAPLSDVPFRVLDAANNELGQGKVGHDGQYTLLFSSPAGGANAQVMLEFLSSDERVSIVKLGGNEPHMVRPVEPWVPGDTPDKKADVLIKLDGPSGPFHLFETLHQGVSFIAGKGYAMPAPTVAEWSQGQQTGTRYEPGADRLYFNGHEDDPDEFDDSVILHEFGHRVMAKLSRDDSPGGDHNMLNQSTPSLAWSEGFATYLAQRTMGTPRYNDKSKGGVFQFDLKPLDSGVSLGTSDGTDKGMLCEATVAGLLWYLQDDVSAPEYDFVAGKESSWFPLFTNQMKNSANLQVGEPGKADLADLLKLWACGLDADSKDEVSTLMEKRFKLDWLSKGNLCGK